MVSRRRSACASLLSIVVFAALSAGCEVTFGADQYTAREEKRFTVTGTATLDFSTFDGSIEVRGWDRPDVVVTIEKRGRDKSQTDAITVNARQDGSAITIDIPRPAAMVDVGGLNWNASPSARIVATVPRTSNLVAKSGDGSIAVERLSGRAELRTGDGSVRVDGLTGDLMVRSGDGSVRARSVEGRADIQTEDGSVGLDGTLRAVRLETGDGSATLTARTGSRMEGDWEVTTGDGSIQVEVPSGFDAAVDAHTGGGRVQAGEVDASGGGAIEKRTVKGRIGAGGKVLRLRSGDGSIFLKQW